MKKKKHHYKLWCQHLFLSPSPYKKKRNNKKETSLRKSSAPFCHLHHLHPIKKRRKIWRKKKKKASCHNVYRKWRATLERKKTRQGDKMHGFPSSWSRHTCLSTLALSYTHTHGDSAPRPCQTKDQKENKKRKKRNKIP